ncbi:hypothetical protein B0H13DRAFT_2410794 [Mycena leptocephala]|nr:hypothetical protein B0H13DRAFT_2410794 [Mycena leptocephala]
MSRQSIGWVPDDVNGGRVLPGVVRNRHTKIGLGHMMCCHPFDLKSTPRVTLPLLMTLDCGSAAIKFIPTKRYPAHYPPHDNRQFNIASVPRILNRQRSTANEPTTTIDGAHSLEEMNMCTAAGKQAHSYPTSRRSSGSYARLSRQLPAATMPPRDAQRDARQIMELGNKVRMVGEGMWGHYREMTKGLPVLWLHGPAGAGKSAIMRTFAERLAKMRLGGSFFFKRGHATRGNAQKLFATIAYQLALCVPQLKSRISQIVEDDPSSSGAIFNPVVLIDGLDECEGHLVQQEILRLIAQSMREHLPLKFLIASRPEPDICKIFKDSLYEGLYHPFNVEQSFEDIKKYLRHEFARIHRDHETMATVAMPWPSQKSSTNLSKSSGYFIYASTVIKFVDDNNFRPTERLERLQETLSSESPFSGIDQLYTQILSRVPARLPLLSILKAITFSKFRLSSITVEKLLELKQATFN